MTDNTEDAKRLRFSIDLDDEHRATLTAIAKSYKITQGEVIEALLDQAATEVITSSVPP